jgi:hypothetical protein
MQNKWFTSWRGQDDSEGLANGTSTPAGGVQSEAAPDSRVEAHSPGNGFASSGVDLMPFEEIYRSAGIRGPRQGYTIGKVIEMLHSEHIKNLPAEMKRSSLLMALEAAGVQVDEVLQDATLRQRAINSYEAIQRKHLEEYEARNAQENLRHPGRSGARRRRVRRTHFRQPRRSDTGERRIPQVASQEAA